MFHKIKNDLYRYHRNTSFGVFVKVFFSVPGFRFTVLKRLCEGTSVLNPIGMLARVWYKLVSARFGFQIPHKVDIGPGFFLGHYGGIVINMRASLGKNCNVSQGVTIGAVSRGEKKGCPTIGDRVWIGANAVVVGNIKIGDDVLIAPLSFVNFDVPAHTLVLGNPAKAVNQSGSEGYINNILS